MFDVRLKILLGGFTLALLVIAVRLTELQVVKADYYRHEAERSLLLQPRRLPFVRGRILDRRGEVLVSDQPCWDLTIDFDAIAVGIAHDPQSAENLMALWRRSGRAPRGVSRGALLASLENEIHDMWGDLDAFAQRHWYHTHESSRDRCQTLYERVHGIREAVARRRGFDAPVAEEREHHTLMPALNGEQQIAARERFLRYPWIQIERSSVRRYAPDTSSLAHVLGRTTRVSAEDIASDPNQEDPFGAYRADETRGVTGVEFTAEAQLRGRRGQVTLDRDGQLVPAGMIEAENGRDVSLTIDADLQRRLYHLLGTTVSEVPESAGGAIVVLDVPRREVLALVSYPAYDPNRFDELYATLRDDTVALPLRFRAVSNRYAPGSTIKPFVCLTGLASGVIGLDSREHCTGYLLPEHRDRWRCWQMHGTSQRKAHGDVDVVAALTGSCNIFMYRLGERLGVDALTSAFDMVGVGRSTGIGFVEESYGINPTSSWLATYKGMRTTVGLARLYAIGQGELSMTPLQVANLMATYASGRYGDVTLVDSEKEKPSWTLPGDRASWQAIRRGMYGVVNDPQGTAYQFAHFAHERFALIGKTGSATAYPWPTAYDVSFVDEMGQERTERVEGGSKSDAIERFSLLFPSVVVDPKNVRVATKWPTVDPESGDHHSHAWFGGFLQRLDDAEQPDWSTEPRVAFAAVVEFGGSGGRTSGPLGRRIAATILETLGEDLRVPSLTRVAAQP